MAEGIYSWQKTPALNDDADDNINWLEGQDPSTVNNSSRQGMSEHAGFRDDLGGVAVSTGDGISYVVSSAIITGTPDHKTINILAVGNVLWFRPNATNVGSAGATLNVNSLGTTPLRILPGIEIAAGQIVANQIIGVFYDGTQWLVVGANAGTVTFNQLDDNIKGQLVKVGFVRPQFEKDTPAGWLVCDGRTDIVILEFPALFEVYGTRYGSSNPGVTFGLPNVKGRAIRGVDAAGTIDPDVALRTPAIGPDTPTPAADEPGSTQADEFKSHNHPTTEAQHNHPVSQTPHAHGITDPGHFHTEEGVSPPSNSRASGGFSTVNSGVIQNTGTKTTGISVNSNNANITIGGASTGLTVDIAGGNETRMDNIYAHWIVLADTALAAESGGPFVVILDGDGTPANTLGNNGDFYVDNLNTIWFGPKGDPVADEWPAGVELVGTAGADGPAGPRGLSGLPYEFSTDIAMPTAPGQLPAGTIRFDDAAPVSVTQVAVSKFIDDGTGSTDVGATLNLLDDSTNVPPGRITIFDVTVLGKFATFFIDTIDSQDTDFIIYGVTYIDDASPLTGGDKVNFTSNETGDQGDQGFTGPAGINPGIVQKFDDGFGNNQDPGDGHFTMDNVVTPTLIHVDDLNDASENIRTWLDSWSSGTTILDKGYLLIKDQALPDSIFRLCTVTAVDAGTGGDTTYVKVTVTLQSGAGTVVDENNMTLEFSKTGNIGSASGDVQGPNGGVVDDEIAVYNGTTGKIIKNSGGALVADFLKVGTFNANTIVKADVNDVPIALDVPEETLLGRITAGVITALTKTQVDTFLGLADLAFKNTVDTLEIDADAVTNVELADMATNTIKGRNTAATGDPEDIPIDDLAVMLNSETVIPALAVPLIGVANLFLAGQRKLITDLISTATIYDWAAETLEDSNDFDLSVFSEGRTLNIPPNMSPLTDHSSQAGEITGITIGGGSLIFGAGWQFPDGTAPTIGENTLFTLYYRSFTLNGTSQINRITDLQGWA